MDSARETYMGNSEWLKLSFMILQLPKYKIVRIVLYTIGICLALVLLATNCLVYNNISFEYFLQDSPFYFMEHFVIFSTLSWISSYTLYTPVISKFKTTYFWNLSMTSKECQKRIKRECWLTQLLYFSELFVCAVFTSLYLNLWAHDDERYYPISAFVVENYPGFSSYFHGCLIGMNFVAIGAMNSVWFVLYLLTYMKFQMYMLTDIWKTLKLDLRKQSSSKVHLYNKKTQKRIKKFLYFHAKRHAEIIESNRIVYVTGRIRNSLLFIFSFLAALFPISTIFSSLFSWKYKLMASVGFFHSALATTALFQLYEDVSDELAAAIYDQDWFLWNKENRQLLIFIHTYTSTHILELPFPPYLRANLELMKSFIKVMYSALNFFYSVN